MEYLTRFFQRYRKLFRLEKKRIKEYENDNDNKKPPNHQNPTMVDKK